MDSTRAYLKALVETKKGVNLRTLSRQIRKNDAYLHQYIYRGTPKTLPENLRYHLATLLGIHESAKQHRILLSLISAVAGY